MKGKRKEARQVSHCGSALSVILEVDMLCFQKLTGRLWRSIGETASGSKDLLFFLARMTLNG